MADRAESADERALRRELQELAKKRETLDNSKRRGSGTATTGAAGRRSVFARLGGEPTRAGGAGGGRQVQLKENNARGNAPWRLGKRDNEDSRQNSAVKRQRLHSAVARPEGSHQTERTETSRTSTAATSPSANSARAQERKQRAVAPYAQKDTIARSRRMFGALMGHLGKAKRQIEKDTDLFKRQDTKQQEAEQREKLQSQDRENRARREAEVARLEALIARAELDRSEQVARAKLEHLQTVRKSESQSKFLVTITSPPICYLPSKHTKETEDLVAASVEAHEAKMKALSQSHDEKLRKLEAEFETKLEQLREELEVAKNGEKDKSSDKEASREEKEEAMEDDEKDIGQNSKEPEEDNSTRHRSARIDRKASKNATDRSAKASDMEVDDEDVQESVLGGEADDDSATEARRSNGRDNDDKAAGEEVKSAGEEERIASPRATANGSPSKVDTAPTTEASLPGRVKEKKTEKKQSKEEVKSPKQPPKAANKEDANPASQEDAVAKPAAGEGGAKPENNTATTGKPKEDAAAHVDKMKVTELRAELKRRGLDVKGLKAMLVQRLKEAMQDEDESK
ncbi:SAP domain [Phytophthora cinnamomi]|uniref:SAP domain n=1 Tax=Phytophthora cinnamomi TaxID=4785 RepID=UPI003559F679|nr:SAP domain [Phytophthora cinnamomi]